MHTINVFIIKKKIKVIDVVGPAGNNLSAREMCHLLSSVWTSSSSSLHDQAPPMSEEHDGEEKEREKEQEELLPTAAGIMYEETPLPPDPAYGGLWAFLRAGGFDIEPDAAAESCSVSCSSSIFEGGRDKVSQVDSSFSQPCLRFEEFLRSVAFSSSPSASS